MKARFFTAVIVATSLLAVPLTASANPTKDEVRAMLSGYEDMPSAAHWRALGPGTLAVLLELYNDRSEPGYVRIRAVNVAAHYPSPATRTFLLAVARARGQSDLFIREAVLALQRAFGTRSIDDVKPFLRSRHLTVREGAAIALGRIGNSAAIEALRRQRVTEANTHIRTVLDREIRRVRR